MKLKQKELLDEEAIIAICKKFEVNTEDITDIAILKKGMTNRAFIFQQFLNYKPKYQWSDLPT